MPGVQSDGSFDRKHIDDIVEDLVDKLRQELGEDAELRQNSPLKQIIDTTAIEFAEQWEALEGSYYASYYEDAFGTQLDRLLALAGVNRLPRRSATGEVKFTTDSANSSDVTIPKGTKVTTQSTQNKPAIPFKTTESATLKAGNTEVTGVEIQGMSPTNADVDEKWLGSETNVGANTVVVIENPISGVDGVTNPEKTGDTSLNYVSGRDRETDAELKFRYENTIAKAGSATVEAIRSEIFNADEDIVNVNMEENVTMNDNTGSGGLPEKSFRATVLGGTDDEVAQAIYDSRAAGIESYGSTTGTATDTDGDDVNESFARASQIDIYVDVSLTTDNTFPTDGKTEAEDNIIRYIGGQTSAGFDFPGTEIAENVIYDQVFAAAMDVQGVVEADVTIGKSDNPTGTANLTIGDNEVARSDSSWIDVTEV